MGKKSKISLSRSRKRGKASKAQMARFIAIKSTLNSNQTLLCSSYSPESVNTQNEFYCSTPTSSSQHKNLTEIEPSLSFISEKDYKSLSEHNLCIETGPAEREIYIIEGNKIVDIQYVIEEIIDLQYEHSKICSVGKLHVANEVNRGSGLISQIFLQCRFCSKVVSFFTEDSKKTISPINMGAVWGTLGAGSTVGHMNQVLTAMNIPPLNFSTFQRIELSLADTWQDSLWKEMELAGNEELQYAKNQNQFDKDGVPYITVYVDGGWSKRLYGHNYNAASGVGVIIGWATTKILYVGVRNKYCSVCARAANKKVIVGVHTCFKNWSGFNVNVKVFMSDFGNLYRILSGKYAGK